MDKDLFGTPDMPNLPLSFSEIPVRIRKFDQNNQVNLNLYKENEVDDDKHAMTDSDGLNSGRN